MRSSNAVRATNVIPLRPRANPEITIECADNLAFMRKLPNESMHLIITSPPYNIGKEYEKRTTNEIYIEQQDE